MKIHPNWLAQPAPEPTQATTEPDPAPTRVYRCLVCKSEFTPTIHDRHQILCGSADCRRSRLRLAQRRYGRVHDYIAPEDRPMSRYTGVQWRNRRTPWYAQIKINGVTTPLGSFATEEEAAAAFRQAAEERESKR